MSSSTKSWVGWGLGTVAGVGLVWASARLGGPPALFAAFPRSLAASPAGAAPSDEPPADAAAVLVVHTSVAAKCPAVASALAEPESRGPDGRPFRPVVRAVSSCLETGAFGRIRVAASEDAWPAIETAFDHLGVDARKVTRRPAAPGTSVHLSADDGDGVDATFVRVSVSRGEVVSFVTDDDL